MVCSLHSCGRGSSDTCPYGHDGVISEVLGDLVINSGELVPIVLDTIKRDVSMPQTFEELGSLPSMTHDCGYIILLI